MKRRIATVVGSIFAISGFMMLVLAAGSCDYFAEIHEAFAFPMKQAVIGILCMAVGVILVNVGEVKYGEE